MSTESSIENRAEQITFEPKASKGFIELSYRNLFWVFIICSVCGLVGETIISTIVDGRLDDRAGLLWGPFSPLYGIGGVLMTLALNRLWDKNPFIVFCVAALAGGVLEYGAGWLLESVFGIVAWSYHGKLLNLGDHTSVDMMVMWGLLGLVWIKALLPLVMKPLEHMSPMFSRWFTVVLTAFMIVNVAMTLLSFDCWYQRQSGVPSSTAVQVFFQENFSDDFMEGKFQTMSLWPDLSKR